MNKSDLLQLLKLNGVVTTGNKRKFCWKSCMTPEAMQLFNDYSKSYRSDEEAWFCLLNNIEPHHCEICGNLAVFNGRKKTKYIGYNSVCENCSANAVESKKQQIKETVSKQTEFQKAQIREKINNTLLNKYGDSNYCKFGSDSFKQNLINKYGDPHYSNHAKTEQTCLKKYGVKTNLLINYKERNARIWKERYDEITNKIKKTCQERYGADRYIQTDDFKLKSKNTRIKNSGDIKESYKRAQIKSKNTKLSKYGDAFFHNKELMKSTLYNRIKQIEKDNNCTQFNTLTKLYGQGWHTLKLPILYFGRFRFISNDYIQQIKNYAEEDHYAANTSQKEKELYEFVKTHTKYRVLKNKKGLLGDKFKNYELDIYIPKLKLAFEFNGDYWHSSKFKDKYYHHIKTKSCFERGIQLVHIYEYQWNDKIRKQIIELLENKDCSKYGWINTNEYKNYILTEPELIHKVGKYDIYNEGKFIKNIC